MPCFNEMFLSTTSFTLHNKQYRNLLHTKYTQQGCGHHKQHTCLPPLPCVPVPPFLAAWCVGGPWWLGAGPPGPWRSSTPSCTHCPHCFVVHKLGPTKYPNSLCKYRSHWQVPLWHEKLILGTGREKSPYQNLFRPEYVIQRTIFNSFVKQTF